MIFRACLHLNIEQCIYISQGTTTLPLKLHEPIGLAKPPLNLEHYSDVIMSTVASQITGVSIVYSTVCSGADQRKHQTSASLTFERGIQRWTMNSQHKGPVTRKIFPSDDVIMMTRQLLPTDHYGIKCICMSALIPIMFSQRCHKERGTMFSVVLDGKQVYPLRTFSENGALITGSGSGMGCCFFQPWVFL